MARTAIHNRKSKKVKGTNRPPVTKKGESTKMFAVAPGFMIGGFDGKRKIGNNGDMIELTKKQAEHFIKLKAIVLELGDFDTEVEDEPVEEKPAKDKAEGSDGNKAERSGDKASGKHTGVPAL